MRPPAHRRTDSDGCSCQSTGSEESCSLTDEYPSDSTGSTRSSLPGGRGHPHTVLSGWNFYSSHHQSRTHHRHHSQERACKASNPHHHRRCSSSSSCHSKRMDSGYNGGSGTPVETLKGTQEPFFLHEPNMTSDDRVKKLFDNKGRRNNNNDEEKNNGNTLVGNGTNGSQIVTVEVHNSSGSEDSNSVSDTSDPIPDYDDQGSQSSDHRPRKTSREVSSLSTDEGIYHGDEEDDDMEEHHHHHHEDEEDDEDELHDNEVSFSPRHQEDLVAIRNKRPNPEIERQIIKTDLGHEVDAKTTEDKKISSDVPKKNSQNTVQQKRQTSPQIPVRKNLENTQSIPPPPPPPLPTKKTEELKLAVKPPTPPPLPKSNLAKSDVNKTRTLPIPLPPELPSKLPLSATKSLNSDESRSVGEDDRSSQKSDETSSVDGEGRRYVKAAATRRNSHQKTLPFIPPQFSFPPDTNENIRPSEYLRQTKNSGSKNSTLKLNSTLHRAVSMGELAISSKMEKISYTNRTESHETLLDNDSRYITEMSDDEPENKHAPLTSTNSNGNTPLFNITVEQLQTVHLKKTDKPTTPERTVLLQKNDLIAELKQTKDIQGVRKMKEERSKIEEVFTLDTAQNFKVEKFVDQIPEVDTNGCVIPPWKRQMLAKKAAEKAKKDAEEQRIRDAEAKKLNSIPPWKRQLMQRKEPQNPVANQNVYRPIPTVIPTTPEPFLPEKHQSEDQPCKSPLPIMEQEQLDIDSDDIPPNPWLQQLRKTKSVFR